MELRRLQIQIDTRYNKKRVALDFEISSGDEVINSLCVWNTKYGVQSICILR